MISKQEKKLERDKATEYEHYVIKKHSNLPDTVARHWKNVPEDWLYESGYINDSNKNRMERLMKQKGPIEGVNRVSDCGFDGMAKEKNGELFIYHGIQAKYYLSRKVTANDLGTFQNKLELLRRINNLSKGFLYTPAELQADLRSNCESPISNIIYKQLTWDPNIELCNKQVSNEYDNLHMLPYQDKLLLELYKSKSGFNGLQSPRGTGKTIIAGRFLDCIKPECIIAVLSKESDRETFKQFLPEYKSLTLDKFSTTDKVNEFLNQVGKKVIFSSYDLLISIFANIKKFPNDSFPLYDEIHNESENKKLWTFTQKFKRGLLVSATMPSEIKGISFKLIKMSFAEAIHNKSIVDYKLWIPNIFGKTDETIIYDKPLEFSKYDKDLCAKAFYLASCMLKTGSRRCIAYLTRKKENGCEDFLKILKDVLENYHGLKHWVKSITEDVKTEKKRNKIIKEFEGGDDDIYRILLSVRILDDSYVIPRCDSIFVTNLNYKTSMIKLMNRIMMSSLKDYKNPSKENNVFLWAEGKEECVESLKWLKESDPLFNTKMRIVNLDYDKNYDKVAIENILEQEKKMEKWVKEQVTCVNIELEEKTKKNNFKEIVLNKSESADFDTAKKEWFIIKKIRKNNKDKCVCDYTSSDLYYIYNIKTNKSIVVGNNCYRKYNLNLQEMSNDNLKQVLDELLSSNEYKIVDNAVLFNNIETKLINRFEKYVKWFMGESPAAVGSRPYGLNALNGLKNLLKEIKDLIENFQLDYLKEVFDTISAKCVLNTEKFIKQEEEEKEKKRKKEEEIMKALEETKKKKEEKERKKSESTIINQTYTEKCSVCAHREKITFIRIVGRPCENCVKKGYTGFYDISKV